MVKPIVLAVLSTAIAETTAEYFGKYNVLDFAKDHVQSLVARVGLKLGDTTSAIVTVALLVGLVVLASRL